MKVSSLNSSVDLIEEPVCHPCRMVSICLVKALTLSSPLSSSDISRAVFGPSGLEGGG